MYKLIQYLLTVSALFFTQNAFAQGPFYEWHKTAGGEGSEYGNSVVVDGSGNIYVAGLFQETIDIDPGDGIVNLVSNGSTDIYIKKMDAEGNLLWAHSFGDALGDTANSVVVDNDGNVYVYGSFKFTVDFNPSDEDFNVAANGSEDIFLLKLDTDGDFVWVKTVGGNSIDIGADMFIQDNHLYLTGWFENTVDFDPGEGVSNLTATAWSDCFVQKLDLDGNFVWAKRIGGPLFDEAHGITVDTDGNVIVVGFFENTVDFDPGIGEAALSSNGSRDVFVLKLDSSGDYVWSKSFGGSGSDAVNAITSDSSGSIYTTGRTNNTVDFNTGTEEEFITSNGAYDVFVHKLNADGDFEWVKTYGSTSNDKGDIIAIDDDGDIYIGGEFEKTVDFDVSSAEGSLTALGGFEEDAFFLKLNSEGEFIWVKAFAGEGGVFLHDVYFDMGQNIYLTGYFYDTNDFNPGDGIANSTSLSSGNGDIFTLKLSPSCNQILNSTETETVCMGDSFTFPDGTTEDNITSQVVYVSELQSIELCDSLVETTVNVVAIDTEVTSFGSVLTASESGSYQWLDCSNGNSEIAGATSQTYTPSVNGEYAVRITKNACEAVSDCIAVNNVGLLENSLGTSVSVYPNPSIGTIQLDLGAVLTGSTTVRINNLLGQTVYESSFHNRQHYEIHFEGSEGMYVLELENENGTRALLPIVKE